MLQEKRLNDVPLTKEEAHFMKKCEEKLCKQKFPVPENSETYEIIEEFSETVVTKLNMTQ
jgi:hypothetical protein